MTDQLTKALIKIDSVDETENRISLETNRGIFSFFKTKKDGGETRAYQDWQEHEIKSGTTVGVAFDTTKKGTDTYQNIKFFIPSDDIQVAERNLPGDEPTATKEVKPRDFEKETLGKVRHGLVCAMLQNGKTSEEIKNLLPIYVDLVMEDEVNVEDIPFE